jgi:hypothetical protein
MAHQEAGLHPHPLPAGTASAAEPRRLQISDGSDCIALSPLACFGTSANWTATRAMLPSRCLGGLPVSVTVCFVRFVTPTVTASRLPSMQPTADPAELDPPSPQALLTGPKAAPPLATTNGPATFSECDEPHPTRATARAEIASTRLPIQRRYETRHPGSTMTLLKRHSRTLAYANSACAWGF